METIKNYLESMFANLPNTEEVRKAKNELLQMMEDKYNELIDEGVADNAAIGTVISEFGNLDELAEDLGLKEEIEEAQEMESENPSVHISLDDVKSFITNRTKKAAFLATGIMLIISSISCPILFSADFDNDQVNMPALGALFMFLFIGIGIGLIVYSSFVDSDWKFLKRQPCQIDMNTASYVKERRRSFEAVRGICISIGVILCIICWVPNIMFAQIHNIGPGVMFILVGVGVFLIVYANKISSGYNILLKLNNAKTIAGSYTKGSLKAPVKYVSKTGEFIVKTYWPTITCLYLILSFATFQWGVTWIIWPIAAVAHNAVLINCVEDQD
ncbi:MAG: permease prefix domain 1-containing protein [Lachnospiraceae bacterium]|nr:permease prefix domain 1-containing protein [Lachnospiraceae bacterium]